MTPTDRDFAALAEVVDIMLELEEKMLELHGQSLAALRSARHLITQHTGDADPRGRVLVAYPRKETIA